MRKNKKSSAADEVLSDELSVNESVNDEKADISDSETQSASAPESEEDAAPLDSLLYDSEDESYESETAEESVSFDAFIKDYQALISSKLQKDPTPEGVDAAPENKSAEDASDERIDASDEKKSYASDKAQEASDVNLNAWDDEITLLPETYEAPDEEDNIFRETPLAEEEYDEDSFSIGSEYYHEEDGEIQLSMFDEASADAGLTDLESDEYKYDSEHPRFIDGVYDFIELFVITLVCVMILTTFVFKHSIVEGRSMQNTLNDGDSLIISDLFYTPERYDIVVFEDYSTSLKKAVVKRVIGLPGEKVEVKINTSGEFEVYINDELLPESYAYNAPDSSPPPTGVWYIEEGEVFVMGDNRYNSTDSRDGGVGPIDVECILGKVIIRVYPFDKFGKVD